MKSNCYRRITLERPTERTKDRTATEAPPWNGLVFGGLAISIPYAKVHENHLLKSDNLQHKNYSHLIRHKF